MKLKKGPEKAKNIDAKNNQIIKFKITLRRCN